MLARFGNWFIGRGFKTDAEYWRDQDKAIKQGSSAKLLAASQHNTPQDRPQLRNGNSNSVRNADTPNLIQSKYGFVWGFVISSPGLVAQFRTIVNPPVRNAWTVQQGD